MKKVNDTLIDLLIGIIIYALVVGIIGLSVAGQKFTFLTGLLLGVILAVIMAVHMHKTINISLDMDEGNAKKFSVRKSLLRSAITLVTLVVAFTNPRLFNALGVILGFLSLKISAYLQPFINKYISKKIYRKGR